MTVLPKSLVLSILVACALLGVLAWFWVRRAESQTKQSYVGYFAPVYSPDGQYVYFVERSSSGTVKETQKPDLFSMSSKYDVSVAQDTFSLKRLRVESGQIDELMRFSPSPLEGQRYEVIGSPFHVPGAGLKFVKGQQLEFGVCLTVHQVPIAREYQSSGVWSEARHAAEISNSWKESSCQFGGNDQWPLFGDWELIEVPGRNFFSPAILAYNHVTNDVKVLIKTRDYDRLYPHGVPLQQIASASRRSAIERTQTMLRTHEELVQKYKSMGMSEIEALLRTGKDMQRLGYYPKTTTMVARLLSREETAQANLDKSALFTIAKDEMESGTFFDIEKAIASPGEEVDRTGEYPIHRDYSNSARLNAYLATGKTQFYVRYLGQTYELTIKKP